MHGRSGMSDMLVSREDFISNHWAAHQEGPVFFFCFFFLISLGTRKYLRSGEGIFISLHVRVCHV